MEFSSLVQNERRFGEWLGLYAPDAEYWVPYAWEHVSLFYETVTLLRMRVDLLNADQDSGHPRFAIPF